MADAKKRRDLTEVERNVVAQWLLQNNNRGVLRYGAKKEAARRFHIDLRTVFRIWKAASTQHAMGQPIHVVSMKKGSKHKDKWSIDEDKVRNISVLERSSIRKLSSKLGVSTTLVHKWIKEKKIKPHTNAIKPFLTPTNMLARLKWSLSMLSCISSNGKIDFQPMYNIIHVDEKWFNLTRTTHRYYILADEVEPHRTCKSKRYIEKIMFMCVVGRPLTDQDGNFIFNGKYGIFPFSFEEPAIRNSKNRPKGSMVTKPVQAITKPVIKQCFLKQIVPIIKAKWPKGMSKHIIIQQDNAKPHISNDDPEFQAIAHSDGFNIQLVCQPANSHDTNVNDLGFFRAIQTLKYENMATTVEGLIKNVQDAFEEFSASKLNDVFLTLQGCYHEIIKVKGNNNYKIPHMNKDRLKRLGILPEVLEVDEQLVRDSLEYVNVQENGEGAINSIDTLANGMLQVYLEE